MKNGLMFLVCAFTMFNCQFSISYSQTWKELMDSTKYYQEKQDFQTSLKWAKSALTQPEKVSVIDTNLAVLYAKFGDIYYNLNNLDSAVYWFEICVKTYESIYPSDNLDLSANMNNLAYMHLQAGNFPKAESLFVKALIMQRNLIKTDNVDLANNITNLAYLYMNQGRFKESEMYFLESLQMYERLFPDDNMYKAINLGNLGMLYHAQANFIKAEKYYFESNEINKRLYKEPHPDLARSSDNLATLYLEIGKINEAEALFNDALKIRKSIYQSDHPDLASSFNNLASLYIQLGRYSEAEQYYKESYRIFSNIYKGNHPNIAISLNNLSAIYKRLGRLKDSERFNLLSLKMSKEIYGEYHQAVLRCKNNLGQLYMQVGEYILAEPLLLENVDYYRKNNKGDNKNLALCISNLASLYQAQKKYDEAEKLFDEVLAMRKRIFKGDHPDIAVDLGNLAHLYLLQYKLPESEKYLIESIELNKRIYGTTHPYYATGLFNHSFLNILMGKTKEAELSYKESLSLALNHINMNFPYLSEREKNQFWAQYSDWFEEFYSFAIRRMVENPSIIGDMYDYILNTKVIIMNSTSKVKRRILNSNDSLLISQYKQWSTLKQRLVKLFSLSKNELTRKNIDLDSIVNLANNLEREISKNSELFAESFEKKKVTWRTIQAFLKPDEAAVEIVRFRLFGKEKFTDTIYYAAIIITDQTTEAPAIVILKNGNELESSAYINYRNNLKTRSGDVSSFDKYWNSIYEKLKGMKKVFLSPDGIYHKVNPATFMKPDGKYLLDEMDIQELNSTKDIQFAYYKTKDESNIYNSAVLIGNPNFSLAEEKVKEISTKLKKDKNKDDSYEELASSRGINLTQLLGTEREIKDIEKFLKNKNWIVNSYLGDNAVKTAIKTANNPRVLHIATHGLFLEDSKLAGSELFGFEEQKMVENPLLRSGLFFTGADNYLKSDKSVRATDDDNGLLTAYEAMNLDLDKTELVVLSACETGLGEIQNGEGVFGLRRAFQQAGAKTVMMSLWKVNDEATQELMSAFYSYWVSGLTKRDAFAKAQQTVRSKYPEPYYWGAFVMVGE